MFSLLLSAALIRGRHNNLQFLVFALSLSITPTTRTSSLVTSMNLVISLPLLLLPGGSRHKILLPIYSAFCLCTCPKPPQSTFPHLVSKLPYMCSSSNSFLILPFPLLPTKISTSLALPLVSMALSPSHTTW